MDCWLSIVNSRCFNVLHSIDTALDYDLFDYGGLVSA